MKGIVFNLLEKVVTDAHGEAAWETLLDQTRLKGAYTSLGNYPDEELYQLVGAASTLLKQPAADIVRWFGRSCIPHFARLYPDFFRPHQSAREFVLTLNDIIHPEVLKLYPGAEVPRFEFETRGPNTVSIGYQSHRKLCAFAEGLVEGTADHYEESVRVEQSECALRGGPRCVLVCTFQPRASPRGRSG